MSTIYPRYIKRAIDFTGATSLLLLTAPIHAVCAVTVRVTSGPPIYFHQERVGRNGRTFHIHKLRTMLNGTEERTQNYPQQASITPVGRALRRTGLDELPQLLNIIVGDMSFVGPRPSIPSQAARYSVRQRERLSVRPGVTGLAQVLYRNSAPWSVRIEADLEYIRTLSLITDIRLLLSTIVVVIRGDGQIVGQGLAEVDDLMPQSSGNHELS